MKYVFFIVCLCMLSVSLGSCIKSYTCRCDGGALGNGTNIDIENKTKDKAQKECDTHNSNTPFGFHNCRLK